MIQQAIAKFGGSSTATPRMLDQVHKIIENESGRNIIVMSGPGKSETHNTKITDRANKVLEDPTQINKITSHFMELYPEANYDELKTDITSRAELNSSIEAKRAALRACGEYHQARLFAERHGYEFVDVGDIIKVKGKYNGCQLLPESFDLIRNKLSENKIYIIPGYYGRNLEGQIATFSRGGSDLTQMIIANALHAKVAENFTDVDGVFEADPKIISKAKKLEEMTYREMRDLSFAGFNILHHAAVKYAMSKNIPIHIRSTTNYPNRGTIIKNERKGNSKKPIIGIAYQEPFCSFEIDQIGLSDKTGILYNILGVFAEQNISIMNPSGLIDEISIILEEEELEHTCPSAIINNIYDIIGNDAEIKFKENLGMVVLAGKGIKGSKGLTADVAKTISDNYINIICPLQGTSERSMGWVVQGYDGHRTVKALYNRFIESNLTT